MKNIHVLPTPNKSRLLQSLKVMELLDKEWLSPIGNVNKNIYITNDEEIKEGDYFYCFENNNVLKCFKKEGSILNGYHTKYKKVVLTTDIDLIKDEVQAIDDEFLEWFVKNPSCEKVDVNSMPRCCGRCNGIDDLCFTDMTCDNHKERGCEICYGKRIEYEIIIPKEEPKPYTQNDYFNDEFGKKEEAKQETLEEAKAQAWIDFAKTNKDVDMFSFVIGYDKGYKLAQERMYSEQEVIKILLARNADLGIIGKTSAVIEFIKQFKKK